MRLIGLDIDGVICDFPTGLHERCRLLGLNTPDTIEEFLAHAFDGAGHYRSHEVWPEAWESVLNDEAFWAGLPPYPGAAEQLRGINLDFYLTARPCSNQTTMGWIKKHGFPNVRSYTIAPRTSKLKVIQTRQEVAQAITPSGKKNVTVTFVEDHLPTVLELANAGVDCYLLSRPWNVTSNPFPYGVKRIERLSEIIERT
jgi:hypothetical protein